MTASCRKSVEMDSYDRRQKGRREQIESQIIDINFAIVIFLSVLTHFLPSWADVIISLVVLVWNVRIAAKLNFVLPQWFQLLLIVQIMSLTSGFNTDHDPFDGEWGGKSEADEWL
jgi:hypothetical protein